MQLKPIWKALILLLMVSGWVTCSIREVGIPLKYGANQIATNMILWWNKSETEGGGGRKPIDQADLATFFHNPEFLQSLGQWDSNYQYRFNVNINIISPFGLYYINILPPYQIKLSGTSRERRNRFSFQFEKVFELTDNPDNIKIKLKYRMPFVRLLKI
ncbi:MAG: hypothetical protein FWG98_08460 [Candidatus Cloacimonetes bacterium]|nr:hypothetical protein [Candidatus Cloacimonadota bacterium]